MATGTITLGVPSHREIAGALLAGHVFKRLVVQDRVSGCVFAWQWGPPLPSNVAVLADRDCVEGYLLDALRGDLSRASAPDAVDLVAEFVAECPLALPSRLVEWRGPASWPVALVPDTDEGRAWIERTEARNEASTTETPLVLFTPAAAALHEVGGFWIA